VKRKKYDKYGADWKHADEFEKRQKQQTSDADRAGYPGFQSESSYSDFFESMFGGSTGAGRSRQVKYRGEDYHTEIQLNLTDAYVLQRKTLSVNGKNIRITIPAGIENGQILKIASHGSPGLNGGPSGDLYVSISVLNNPDLKRLAENLYKTVHLNLYTAILGGEITIETLNGKVKIKVKAGTQNGSTVKLKGKGFPVYKNEGNYGDMFVTYSITIPTNLTEKQKNIFAELSQD
jgi:curved DNA-binding protein